MEELKAAFPHGVKSVEIGSFGNHFLVSISPDLRMTAE